MKQWADITFSNISNYYYCRCLVAIAIYIEIERGDMTFTKKQVLETLLIRYKNGYNLIAYEIKFLINESKLARKVADKIKGELTK